MRQTLILLILLFCASISQGLDQDDSSTDNQLDVDTIDLSIEERFSNQEKLIKDQQIMMNRQQKLIENLINRLDVTEEKLRYQENMTEELIQQLNVEKNSTWEKFRDQENLMEKIIEKLNTDINGTEVSSNKIRVKRSISPQLEERVSHLEKLNVFRTCAELQQSGVQISGFYDLDPDGIQIGHPPIKAYCNFEGEVAITEIPHNNDEKQLNIPYCNSKFCHAQDFTYTAHIDQILALMELSSFSDQTIEFDCNGAPLSQGGIQFGAWVDRHGQDQVYFHGANHGRHTCSCESTNTCSGNQFFQNTCNCNNPAEWNWIKDSGKLTNMTALPVTSFKYGPFMSPTKQAKVSVGRLSCGGRKNVDRVPHSCRDLKLLGETRPGLYLLQDGQHNNYPKMSFCQLDQPGYEDDLEIESQWIKLSSGPGQVFFGVRQNAAISSSGTITFDVTLSNEGQAMNPSTGVFTAPVDGIYDFKLNGLAVESAGETYVTVFLNGASKLHLFDSNSYGNNALSRAWQFNLKQGDEVKLTKPSGQLHGGRHGLYFIGMLM